jgi:hypothetical protein
MNISDFSLTPLLYHLSSFSSSNACVHVVCYPQEMAISLWAPVPSERVVPILGCLCVFSFGNNSVTVWLSQMRKLLRHSEVKQFAQAHTFHDVNSNICSSDWEPIVLNTLLNKSFGLHVWKRTYYMHLLC